jgi:hypothetical protein
MINTPIEIALLEPDPRSAREAARQAIIDAAVAFRAGYPFLTGGRFNARWHDNARQQLFRALTAMENTR